MSRLAGPEARYVACYELRMIFSGAIGYEKKYEQRAAGY